MIGIVILTVTALILGAIIELVDHFLKEADNNYLELLPGYNCGSCGFGSCKGMSEAMEENILNYKKCRPLRGEQLKKMEDYLERSGKL